MNTLILMMFAVGAEPDAELERARAAVAVEIAKAQLSAHAPDDGVKSGHWELRRHWDGRVWHQTWVLKGEVKPVAASSFRGGFNASHSCPVCGRSQYVVSGRGPVPGSHTHTCAAGHTWWH